MKEEIFDVVNDKDEVVGHRPRREVHRLKLVVGDEEKGKRHCQIIIFECTK